MKGTIAKHRVALSVDFPDGSQESADALTVDVGIEICEDEAQRGREESKTGDRNVPSS